MKYLQYNNAMRIIRDRATPDDEFTDNFLRPGVFEPGMQKQNLVSFHILEKESAPPHLVTWTYPSVKRETAAYLEARCFPPLQTDGERFFYLRKNNLWMYVRNFLHAGKHQALVVISEEFVPAKYKTLCDLFAKKFAKTGKAVELVRSYVKLICGGIVCGEENGSNAGMLDLKGFAADFGLKDLISDFGLEIILIYNAILLKRRILVYHHGIEKLQEKMAAMTCLVPIRDLKENLLPWIQNANELKGIPFYVAGTTEENALSHERYYDLYVNLILNEITISKAARECFVMAKVHKDLAHFLVQTSQSDKTETEIIELVKIKTEDVVRELYSLATSREGRKMLTMHELKERKYNPTLENFLFNLAIAENIMML